jgi:ATP-dependent RNA helicase SUPV3L1/SUV3
MSALSGAQHLAGSGRTSFPVDKLLDRDAYRVLGYRQCGERAVRVDILERLADLIRPALAWRETSPGQKPAGAFDGRGFTVTQAMTSLTGSAGDDFASILRALGYRMERRPPPPPKPAPVVAETAAEAAPAEAASETLSEAAAIEAAAAGANLVAAQPPITADNDNVAGVIGGAAEGSEQAAPSSVTLLPDVMFSPAPAADETAALEVAPDEILPDAAASAETPAAEAPQEQITSEATAETVVAADAALADADVTPAAPEAAAAPEPAAVPELVEVWRPGGRSDERRPRHDRNRHRHHQRPGEGATPAAAAGEGGEPAKHERHRRGRRDRNPEFRKPPTEAPAEAATAAADGAPAREAREDRGRPPRERFQGRDKDQGREDKPKGKFGGGREKGGRDKGGRDKRPDSGPSHRQYATSAPPRERERPIDPNSPFAKLAALKEQLTANRKDG